MLILGQKACFLGPTIFEIPRPNWYYCLAGSSKMAPRIFIFFNCCGCQKFILCEIYCYLCPQIFWVHYFSLSQCAWTFAKSTKLPPISENDPNKLSIRHRNSYVTRCASTICYLHAKFLMQSKGEASCVCERNFDQNSWRIPLLSISLL